MMTFQQMIDSVEASGGRIVGFIVAPDVMGAIKASVTPGPATWEGASCTFRIRENAMLPAGCVMPEVENETPLVPMPVQSAIPEPFEWEPVKFRYWRKP